MNIENYISQLLYRYQCVTVTGFGAFLTEIQSAQLLKNSNSFFPPKKLISFNSNIKNNDGLLVNHIALAEKTTYEIALKAIENVIFDWKNKLNTSGVLSLKNIGELTLNAEKNIVFTPYEQLNYLTSSFGLTSYVSPVIKREVYKELVEEVEEKAPIVLAAEKRNSKPYLKYAAMFVLGAGLLTAAGFYGNNFYQNKIEQQTLLVQTNVQKQLNQKIQEATFFIENPLPNVTLNVSSNTVKKTFKLPYHVVAGAFRVEENAAKSYVNLLKLGYKARRVGKNKYGLYPVLYGSFSSYAEAQQKMNEVKSTNNNQVWILVQEL
jgi:CCDC81-like prokaryotic HU domain 2/CCDC81-like prokaryotic HU domain 1/SPOR domain